jgi:hypothetical protein
MSTHPQLIQAIADAGRLVRTDYKKLLKGLAWPMLLFFFIKFSWVPFAKLMPLPVVILCMFLGLIPLAWVGTVCLRVAMTGNVEPRGWTMRETFSAVCLMLVVVLSIPPWAIATVILKVIHNDAQFQFIAYAHFIIGWIFSVAVLLYLVGRCMFIFPLVAKGEKILPREIWAMSKGRVLPLILILSMMVFTTHYIVGYVGYDVYPGANAHLFAGAVLLWCFNMMVLGCLSRNK